MQSGERLVQRVYLAKSNKEYQSTLIEDYLPYIKSQVNKFSHEILPGDYEDRLSIAVMAFLEAIEGYDRYKGNFISFSSLVIKSRLIDYARKYSKDRPIISLDQKEDEELALSETLSDPRDFEEEFVYREVSGQEINELAAELEEYNISFSDLVATTPKQDRTLKSCQKAINFILGQDELVKYLKSSKKLQISKISKSTSISKKTLERHRKYIIAIVLIMSNGYSLIEDHLKKSSKRR